MIFLTSLTAVLFLLTLAATIQLIRYEYTSTKNSSRRPDVVHLAEEPKRRVEVFSLREQPVLLYQSLSNLYKKPK